MRDNLRFWRRGIFVLSLAAMLPCGAAESVKGFFEGGAKMICLASRGREQMFGTVFVSPAGRVAVVDGGSVSAGAALADVLKDLGGRVDYWFVTHYHDDHYGALYRMMTDFPERLPKVGELHYAFPPDDWIRAHEPSAAGVGGNFRSQLLKHKIYPRPLRQGEVYDLGGGTTFEVLNGYDLSLTENALNNASICLSVRHGGRTLLVTGDLGEKGGERLLGLIPEKLPHDVVFAAHHGSAGVGKSFYAAVKPTTVIWPTTDWLWENDAGAGVPGKSKGPGSGTFQTNFVKGWFQELGVRRHYVLDKADLVFE